MARVSWLAWVACVAGQLAGCTIIKCDYQPGDCPDGYSCSGGRCATSPREGEPCTSGQTCAQGLKCLNYQGVCRRECTVQQDCTENQQCAAFFGACEEKCVPWGPDCPSGQSCYLNDGAFPFCALTGNARAGEACVDPVDCADGLDCVGQVAPKHCAQRCNSLHGCPHSTACPSTNLTVDYCPSP